MITKTEFGPLSDGRIASLWRIENPSGAAVTLTDYGARIVELTVPDAEGRLANVVIGFDSPAQYEADRARYFGATIGRCANRIGGARFTLGGREYRLTANNATNTLHGGPEGFDRRLWSAKAVGDDAVEMCYTSPDMEEGFPARLDVSVTFRWTNGSALEITYKYVSDGVTPVSLTNHAYFNLAGGGSAMGHVLTTSCAAICESTAVQSMTGRYLPVAGTPFDFRQPHALGERIDGDDEQLRFGSGYDHAFVFTGWDGSLRYAAALAEPVSRRLMTVFTDLPSVQLYTGNYLSQLSGRGGAQYPRRGAVCLETQFCPDAVNIPQFASPVTEPGREYLYRTVYAFSTLK